MARILLVEDDVNIASLLKRGLEEDNHHVLVCYDGLMGLQVLGQQDFDLVILDIMLPNMSGLEVCQTLRKQGFTDLPVLMLTALGTSDSIVRGLDTGADDYLTKPFKLNELLARVRALVRRRQLSSGSTEQILRCADLVLEPAAHKVSRAGQPLRLTPTEYRLLVCLMQHQGRVCSRAQLMEQVWDYTYEAGSNVVDVYMSYLRNKVDKHHSPRLLHTVVGMGYMLTSDTHEDT
ncbi:MAG: response regulator transcription factor [Bacteroidetes bacterium]|nr:response regulator transcription factor [Bacteroidota bacterium]